MLRILLNFYPLIFVTMIGEYSNEYGKVFVVSENSFLLEKYYNTLDLLYNDESYLINEIFSMDFVILDRTIYNIKNEKYLRIADWDGVSEPNGPEYIWMVKYDLEYRGD